MFSNGKLIGYKLLYLDVNYFIVAPLGTDRGYVLTISIQTKLSLCVVYFQKHVGIGKFRKVDIC